MSFSTEFMQKLRQVENQNRTFSRHTVKVAIT